MVASLSTGAWVAIAIGAVVAALLARYIYLIGRAVISERLSDFFGKVSAIRMLGWKQGRQHNREMEELMRRRPNSEDEPHTPFREIALAFWLADLSRVQPTPRIKLRGVHASGDALWNGEMIMATAAWWNTFLRRRRWTVRFSGLRSFDAEDVERLATSLNPENRELLAAVGAHYAPSNERLGGAAVALSYSFARMLVAGTSFEEGYEAVFTTAPMVTAERLAYFERRYGIAADYEFEYPAEGWWLEKQSEWLAWRVAIAAIRWSYNNQVRRWEKAEGRTLGKGVGWALEQGELVSNFGELLFEQGGRFLDAELASVDSAFVP